MKKIFSLFLASVLVFSLSSCGGQVDQTQEASSAERPSDEIPSADSMSWEYPSGPAPKTEYERVFWYGFVGEEPSKGKEESITEKELTDMLAQVISARGGDRDGWETLTSGASEGKKLSRDYGGMLLLYAAEHMDATAFTNGFAPYIHSDQEWRAFYTDRDKSGYGLLGDKWKDICVSISSQRDEGSKLDYATASREYAVSRLSLVTGATLLDFSFDSNTLEMDSIMTYEAGAIAVVRLFESFRDVADRFPEDSETSARAGALLQEAKNKRDAILSSETAIIRGDTFIPGETYTGTAYYIANSGDDSAAGTSPETAWATIDRLNRAQLYPGDAVFFNRGDIWRAVQIDTRKGVTYSAYGTGEKPRLYGSVESGAGTGKWILWHEGENGEKIWIYLSDMPDCGAIVLNGGEAVAGKAQAFWNGQAYQTYSALWHTGHDAQAAEDQAAQPIFDPITHLTEDMTFFAQASGGLPDTLPVRLLGWDAYGDRDEPYGLTAKGPLYLRCDRGNPEELYKEIEFLSPYCPFDGIQEDVVIDNLAIRYTGRSGLVAAPDCGGTTVQNCEIGWIGGCTASYALEEAAGYTAGIQRNGGGVNSPSSRNTFQNNYVHETYQEGLSVESAAEFGDGKVSDVTDVLIEGNVLYHCASSLLYFNWDEEADPNHQFRNISYRGNYVLYTGMGSWTDSGNTSGAFMIDGGPNMQDGTVEITDNVFFASADCLVYVNTYVPEYLPDFEGNLYMQLGDQPLIFSETAPVYFSVDVQAGIRGFLGDQSGDFLALPRSRWGTVEW